MPAPSGALYPAVFTSLIAPLRPPPHLVRCQPYEVLLPAKRTLLEGFAAVLDPSGTAPLRCLLSHGAAAGVRTTRLELDPRDRAAGSSTERAAGCTDDGGPQVGVEVREVPEPHVYSIIGQDRGGDEGSERRDGPEGCPRDGLGYSGGLLNVRASWLVGRPVYGRVLLTRCRASMNPKVGRKPIPHA